MTPAVAEQTFVLNHVACIAALARHELFSAATRELIDAVLNGAGAFAVGSWAPLERTGDIVGARLGPDGVTMPPGFIQGYRAYVDAGWGMLGVPTAFDGAGLPMVLAAAVQETLGSANLGFALAPMLTMGVIEALIHHGTPAQQALYLPRLVKGEWTGTMNLTEPQAGSDVGALRCKAIPRSNGSWALKGSKIFISFGDHDLAANIVHLVLARTPGAPAGTKGISLFLVPKYRYDPGGNPVEANDVRVVSIEHKMGLHASPTCVLSFGDTDDCIGELVGDEGGGMRAMFTMMNNARLNVALQGVQVAERATQRAVAYARDRIQSPRAGSPDRAPIPIIEHPDVRRMLLRMKAQTQAARALVYHAMSMVDRLAVGDENARATLELLTPLAKAHATDVGNEVASLGLQVHGGMGYIEETGAAQHVRDARILPIYEGTNGIQAADLVGRKLMADGGASLLSMLTNLRNGTTHSHLASLLDDCERVARALLVATVDDRLAASYPFLTMLSVAVCGGLMEKQGRAAQACQGDSDFLRMKTTAVLFYLDHIVPEARGLAAAALASAAIFYAIDAGVYAA